MKFRLNPQKWTPISVAWAEGLQPSTICKTLLDELDVVKGILESSTNDWDQAGARSISERISRIQSFHGSDAELLRNPMLIEEIYQLACLEEELDRIESTPAWKICESIRDQAKRALVVEKER